MTEFKLSKHDLLKVQIKASDVMALSASKLIPLMLLSKVNEADPELLGQVKVALGIETSEGLRALIQEMYDQLVEPLLKLQSEMQAEYSDSDAGRIDRAVNSAVENIMKLLN